MFLSWIGVCLCLVTVAYGTVPGKKTQIWDSFSQFFPAFCEFGVENDPGGNIFCQIYVPFLGGF